VQFIACGDLHFVEENPEKRTDHYLRSLCNKWKFITTHAFNNNISIIICPGDIFETHRASNNLIAEVMDLFKQIESIGCKIFSIFGQHDLAHRSEENSPLNILDAARVIRILDDKPYNYDNCDLYGCSFNQKIPMPQQNNLNVLVIHKMISDNDYWYGNVKYTQSERFIDDNPEYEIIISGDNHQTFSTKYNGHILLNAGSLGRKRIDQIDHKPCFFIVDTDSISFEQVFIPIQPSRKVFNLSKEKSKKEENNSLNKFIEMLPRYTTKNEHKIKPVKALLEYVSENQVEEGVIGIINECTQGLSIE